MTRRFREIPASCTSHPGWRALAVQRLVEAGNSVLIIEHNLDVIKCADWLIDLGPEGGDRGGEIIACGTPEDLAKVTRSYTGMFLRKLL